MLKKDEKLQIVHNLQPLNRVFIRNTGLSPNFESFVELFAAQQYYIAFDLYWKFDACKVYPKSRDITAFITLLKLVR